MANLVIGLSTQYPYIPPDQPCQCCDLAIPSDTLSPLSHQLIMHAPVQTSG